MSLQQQISALQDSVQMLTELVLTLQPPDGRRDPLERISLKVAAKEVGVNYFTLREWVVEKKLIKFSRVGNKPRGGIRIIRKNLMAFMDGKNAGAKPSTTAIKSSSKRSNKRKSATTPSNQVSII